ncbi:phosphoenolpyruvate synthase, partial [Vibrio parahaemolyticus]|uniref:PEP/pyruvate-binding domain-containing protein n=1 Tax=Vibrio parahaemolyticus TaxID=670 RepID=UPI00273A66BD
RSEKASSGVLFTLDTESVFDLVVFITSYWGLGEMVVQGAVNPDEFYVHKTMLESGENPIVNKTFGSKLIKMIYSNNQEIGT